MMRDSGLLFGPSCRQFKNTLEPREVYSLRWIGRSSQVGWTSFRDAASSGSTGNEISIESYVRGLETDSIVPRDAGRGKARGRGGAKAVGKERGQRLS